MTGEGKGLRFERQKRTKGEQSGRVRKESWGSQATGGGGGQWRKRLVLAGPLLLVWWGGRGKGGGQEETNQPYLTLLKRSLQLGHQVTEEETRLTSYQATGETREVVGKGQMRVGIKKGKPGGQGKGDRVKQNVGQTCDCSTRGKSFVRVVCRGGVYSNQRPEKPV